MIEHYFWEAQVSWIRTIRIKIHISFNFILHCFHQLSIVSSVNKEIENTKTNVKQLCRTTMDLVHFLLPTVCLLSMEQFYQRTDQFYAMKISILWYVRSLGILPEKSIERSYRKRKDASAAPAQKNKKICTLVLKTLWTATKHKINTHQIIQQCSSEMPAALANYNHMLK